MWLKINDPSGTPAAQKGTIAQLRAKFFGVKTSITTATGAASFADSKVIISAAGGLSVADGDAEFDADGNLSIVGNLTVTGTINGSSFPVAPPSGDAVPTGCVLMWTGAADMVPSGWALCDGTGGTPDLRGKFILGSGAVVGEGGPYASGDTGGSATHTHGEGSTGAPSSTSGVNTDAAGTDFLFGDAEHNHTIAEGDHIPPFYALAFIIKT